MMSVLVVDDHPIFRAGVIQILEEFYDSDSLEIQEAGTGQQALNMLHKKKCDLVILDISLPGLNGLEILKDICFHKLAGKVLVLSAYSEEQYAVESLRYGAAGYLNKQSTYRELSKAVKRIMSGEVYISQSLAKQMIDEITCDPETRPHEKLSPREMEVVCYIAQGKSIKEIAHRMSVSCSAVSTHRARALEKLSLRNNAELIRYALKNGLID